MSMQSSDQPVTHMQLFIANEDEHCTAVQNYLVAWVQKRKDVTLQIIPILDDPIKLIRLEINYTPALVVNNKLITQNCSVDEVKAFLAHQFKS